MSDDTRRDALRYRVLRDYAAGRMALPEWLRLGPFVRAAIVSAPEALDALVDAACAYQERDA